jgi:hypothetical protein
MGWGRESLTHGAGGDGEGRGRLTMKDASSFCLYSVLLRSREECT